MTSPELPSPYQSFLSRIQRLIPAERLLTDPLSTLAFGTDASFYRLIPKVVVRAANETEVVETLAAARMHHLPVTFRAAGTSLSGQAVSDSILLTLAPGSWREYTISPDASTFTALPGVVGSRANAALLPFGRKIGPDPASINAAMIGGIAANNASGMCCGTAQNSYHTLRSMRVVLPEGSILDTSSAESIRAFTELRPDIIGGLSDIVRGVRANGALADRIARKYRMKNTTGYGLNALLDFDDPVDVFQHLMIGSEGTLGFISRITYNTVVEHPHKASALLLFPDLREACTAVSLLKSAPVEAVELMDRQSMSSVEGRPGIPAALAGLDSDAAALLVETRAATREQLVAQIAVITTLLSSMRMVSPPAFTADPAESAALWNVRKGLFPSVGAMRDTGTTCIIEDVAFPVQRLADATLALQRLLRSHGYEQAIIFGHALEGNLHFVFSQDFNSASEIARYDRLMKAVASLVVDDFDGSLKAEHGTGRNMAPFVRKEWGDDAYGIMKRLKQLIDPDGLLNPGVIINDDPDAHLKSLKPLPVASPIVDKCIECGFCEVHCPSKDLSITPRQRIAVVRELARLTGSGGDVSRLEQLRRDFRYAGDETCATDGLCSIACPVGINTGQLIKDIRSKQHGKVARRAAALIGRNFAFSTAVIRFGLRAVTLAHALLGSTVMGFIAASARTLSFNTIPAWNKFLPSAGKRISVNRAAAGGERPEVVYFPSCINRSFGSNKFEHVDDSVTTRMMSLLDKAGYSVIIPPGVDELCCGMAFDSKGFKEEGRRKFEELHAALRSASRNGSIPIVTDMSPCLSRMRELLPPDLKVYEPVEFTLKFLADRLHFSTMARSVAVHATCSMTKMGQAAQVAALAGMCAETVVQPEGIGCCGWAGDRGFLHPELNASALNDLSRSLPAEVRQAYSNSRTCEIGLSLHSGIPYSSIIYLVDEATLPRVQQK
jgi:D-lactate dehydrogenase